MVDLKGQYSRIKSEIDEAVLQCISSAEFINGPMVKEFERNLASYLGVRHVIGCANGTDALQIAMMARGLRPGDEVIVPAFTYAATAEAAALLGLTPVMVDVDPNTFNVTAETIEANITERTRAVVPVHLFGQSCEMNSILELCASRNIFVIEDNAQALGSTYSGVDGRSMKTGTLGDVGCTSFFPSKNLGEYEDLLSTHNFFRVTHSALINLTEVKKNVRGEGGYVIMSNGDQVEVSKRKKDAFINQFAKK